MKKIKNLIFLLLFSLLIGAGTLTVSANATSKDSTTPQNTNQQETQTTNEKPNNECKGIKLNTDFPFIWRCIGISGGEAGVNQTNAFAFMIKGIMKFIITIIMIMSVLMIVVAGVLMTTGGVEKSNYSKGIEMIKNVAWALALLGASGVILKLINPNFFT